ncbi:hypothetical protein A4R26_17280 [Niastella populi]|uniref:Uncharacterized protein n=1 Tax=Niastella populi TaxID=550983 RepID=A0A1V9FX86_9BACT|nr:hypothetical protein A4R26_17280 [Niastella populi]
MLIIFIINDNVTGLSSKMVAGKFNTKPHNGSHCGMKWIIQMFGKLEVTSRGFQWDTVKDLSFRP